MIMHFTHVIFNFIQKQESIPVGCILPACQPYVLLWPPDVSTSGGAVKWGLMNKFQLVSSDGHQMSLVGGGARAGGPICPKSGGAKPGTPISRGGTRGCTVRPNEQVSTGLHWWPPDVTSRGWGQGQRVPMSQMSQVWRGMGLSQGVLCLGGGARAGLPMSHVWRGPVQWVMIT